MTNEEFEDLTAAALDGRPILWDRVELTAKDGVRQRLAALKIVCQISNECRRTHHNPEPTPERIPHFDGYNLVRPLAAGSWGTVWEGYDLGLDRTVALKVLPCTSDGDTRSALREARLLARLSHPNVPAIFGTVRTNRAVAIAMEYVPGVDLAAYVRQRGPLATRDVIAIASQLAGALDEVHGAGILHGDIKASNVKWVDGRAVLLDFGSGRIRAFDREDLVKQGTPLYLAPELRRGSAPSVQSDLYSLGVLLFFLHTGGYPSNGSNRSVPKDLAGFSTRRFGLAKWRMGPQLAHAIDALMAENPADRPESAQAVLEFLSIGAGRNRRAGVGESLACVWAETTHWLVGAWTAFCFIQMARGQSTYVWLAMWLAPTLIAESLAVAVSRLAGLIRFEREFSGATWAKRVAAAAVSAGLVIAFTWAPPPLAPLPQPVRRLDGPPRQATMMEPRFTVRAQDASNRAVLIPPTVLLQEAQVRRVAQLVLYEATVRQELPSGGKLRVSFWTESHWTPKTWPPSSAQLHGRAAIIDIDTRTGRQLFYLNSADGSAAAPSHRRSETFGLPGSLDNARTRIR